MVFSHRTVQSRSEENLKENKAYIYLHGSTTYGRDGKFEHQEFMKQQKDKRKGCLLAHDWSNPTMQTDTNKGIPFVSLSASRPGSYFLLKVTAKRNRSFHHCVYIGIEYGSGGNTTLYVGKPVAEPAMESRRSQRHTPGSAVEASSGIL